MPPEERVRNERLPGQDSPAQADLLQLPPVREKWPGKRTPQGDSLGGPRACHYPGDKQLDPLQFLAVDGILRVPDARGVVQDGQDKGLEKKGLAASISLTDEDPPSIRLEREQVS